MLPSFRLIVATFLGAFVLASIGLHLAACSLLGVSVWLGGELVYRHGVAVLDDEDEGFLVRHGGMVQSDAGTSFRTRLLRRSIPRRLRRP